MTTLERLRELDAKATPGPWYGRQGMFSNAINLHGEGQSVIGALCVEDAELVITMRNALPKLLALVDAGEKMRQENTCNPLLTVGQMAWDRAKAELEGE